MQLHKWIKLYIFIPTFIILFIFSFNFIIDPYSMTSYNVLNIPNKFARDDRQEKVTKLYVSDSYDNIIFGSSRVYNINPLVISKYLGGTSYNAGVGTARIEDYLGFLLYLERIQKLPKNIILGLDFYSFNPTFETNTYFLKSSELNFMHESNKYNLYFSKFISIDALRASTKTLKNFLKESKDKPRFNSYGSITGTENNFNYYPEKTEHTKFTQESIAKTFNDIKKLHYPRLSQKRLTYLTRIISLAKRNNIKTYFYITPLNAQLLSLITRDEEFSKRFIEFKRFLAETCTYNDFATINDITNNRFFFGGDAMHGKGFTGNLVLARLFNDKNISLPEKFGTFIPKEEVSP